MHPFIELAWKAIETYLAIEQIISPPNPLPPEWNKSKAVFVSLRTGEGQLRGCRGTVRPTQPTLAEAVIHTAIASAVDDPRFPPMSLAEMEGLEIKVDVLSELEPVTNIEELDPQIYGVVMKSQQRRAVLLPDIPTVDTVGRQLELVRRKAGIEIDEPIKIYRFTVTRYAEDEFQC